MTTPSKLWRHAGAALALLWGALLWAGNPPADSALPPGTALGQITSARGAVFEEVVVKSVTPSTLYFTHKGGLASLPLKDLPADLQRRAGFDPAAAAAENSAREKAVAEAKAKRAEEAKRRTAQQKKSNLARYEAVIQAFGSEPELRTEVDLRPKFFELELGTKSQGRRPSCAVFAVVSAVEFLHAQQTGKAEKFSEEYLIWATLRTVKRPPTALDQRDDADDVRKTDAGFALHEVVAALRGYGIPLLAAMPNSFGKKMEDIPAPSPAVVADARQHQRVFIHAIPGRTSQTALSNIVHILNAGIPVPVGMRWPNQRSTFRSGFLSDQRPVAGYAHAVTLVGYRCPSGKRDDLVFLFKNSYGPDWGSGGFGMAAYRYLERHLLGCVLLEVQTPESPASR